MGKNLIQQRRGKGNTRYRSPSHRFRGKVTYGSIPQGATQGVVSAIIDAPGRTTPLAEVTYGDKTVLYLPNAGMSVGQTLNTGEMSEGNIVTLRDVPEGTRIFNIELTPGDGGRLCRSSGTTATVIAREASTVTVLMPSKQQKKISGDCRATIGATAGFGRKDKPFMKAGNKHYAMKAMGKLTAITSPINMNAVQHPFGGKNLGKQKNVARGTPPGRKVGNLWPRRTGKKKR
ncbi:MAG: 50S ribosomal protein L2 [Candidatus Aenigmarchaeota archaeon]|nr:50S ribosomal protein L2 [Candidatus Aenigmarchaeota archaeon]